MVLAAGELAALQAAAAQLLDTTADIKRNTSGTFAIGQPTESETTVATGIAAGLASPSKAMLQQYAGIIGTMQAWIVKFPAGQDVQPRDRVIIDGMTLTVQASLNPESYSTLNRVMATKIG